MRIVAFVGADGTGKSTQAEILTNRLCAAGKRARLVRPVFLLLDPWKLRERQPISAALSPRMQRLDRSNGGHSGRTTRHIFRSFLGYLYALATIVYLRSVFCRDDYVVCDRYLYQYLFDVFGPTAASLAKVFPRPDRVFWIDGEMDLLRARSAKPLADDDVRYYAQVLRFYRELAEPLHFVRMDAADDIHTIHERAFQNLPPAGRFGA